MKRKIRGVTIVEMLVGTAIMVMLLGLVIWVFFFSRKTQGITEHLDAFHLARVLNYSISSVLKFSNGPIYPVVGSSPSPKANHIIFRDTLNKVKAIILTPEKNLLLIDYDDFSGNRLNKPRLLGRNVSDFEVVVHPSRAIEYKIIMVVDKRNVIDQKRTHVILDQVFPANSF